VHALNANSSLDAWRSGVRLLLASGGEAFNVITTIENPLHFDPIWLDDYSPHSVIPECDRVQDVIATIFPYRLAQRLANRQDFYKKYLALHQRAMHWPRNRARWGTYFERLVSFGEKNRNQLEIAIDKLQAWPKRSITGLVFHLSSPETDNPRTRGGPCWHFAELLWQQKDVIDMVVVYRNHDFFNKVLGNYLALGKLLDFIAQQSKKKPGRLICHSVHAYSERPQSSLVKLAGV